MPLSWNRTTLTHRKNRDFVGRDSLLDSIHDKLSVELDPDVESREPVSCLLQGLGGIGKSQTALEYCYRYQHEYKWQFWITAETETKLRDSIQSIYNKLPQAAKVSQSPVSDTLTWLENTDDEWLAVFDNVEDDSSVFDAWAPRKCRGRSAIILTSQLTAIGPEVDHVFPMDSLSVEEGAQLLVRHRYGTATVEDNEQKAALDISRRFSGLPLALAHIGGFIKESGSSLAEYEEIFNDRYPAGWRGKTHATRQYEKPVEVVWNFALSEDQLSPAARKLIRMLSFLDPDGVPEGMLLRSCRENSNWGFEKGAEKAEFLAMRRSLHKRSLISIGSRNDDNAFFTMHRSLQYAILLQLDEDASAREAIFLETLRTLRLFTPKPSPKQIPNLELVPQFEVVIAHIISFCKKFVNSIPPMKGSLEFAELLYAGGFFLWERQVPSTEASVLVLGTALKVLDDIDYPADGRLRADLLTILALCSDRLGPAKYTDGLAMRKQARQIRIAIKDKEMREDNLTDTTDRLLYNSINDQGVSELHLNRFHEAERLFEDCFRKYKTWGSESAIPFEYSKYYHNMGIVKMCQGLFPQAVEFEKRSVELSLQHEGKRTSRVAWFQYDYACTILQAGDTQGALDSHMQILTERESMSGKHSEATLQSYYTVGAMYHHLGNLEEAERYIRESIERARSAGRGKWPECSLGRAFLHLSRILAERSASEEEIKKYKDPGEEILAKYRHISQQFTPQTDDDLVLYDSLQPSFNGRYTGRHLIRLLQKMTSPWKKETEESWSIVVPSYT